MSDPQGRSRVRPAFVVLLLILPGLALGFASAQAPGPVATLELDVQADHAETMTLSFEGLKRLTRYDGICLPEGATESRVYDEVGDVTYTTSSSPDGRRTISFLARGEVVHIDMARAGPSEADRPLYAANVNFCVPATSSVVIHVNVPEGHTLFFLSGGGTISGRTGTASSDGPTHLFYSYEAPIAPSQGITLIEAAPFRVYVASASEAEARRVAELAAGPYRDALTEAGLDAPFDGKMRVLFQPTTPFPWEAGHYNGHGFVAVKEDTLVDDATAGFPLSAVRVLVHESFHAASFPLGKGAVEDAVAWWLEGTAKHSERQVDAALPNATIHCTKDAAEVRCWDFDDRISRADLDTGYESGFRFQTEWEPSAPQSEDTRRFYYSYSEFVVEAWIARHSVAEYQRVWDEITAAFEEGEGCPCAEGWLLGLLDDEDLFQPWQDVKSATPTEFEALVKPFTKDEEALQRELDARSNPLAGIPVPGWIALAALLVASLVFARKPKKD